jgi:NadR type nicotinamide-nucleotide adenylyltransferase
LRYLAHLDPHVRAHFVRRVCLVGAESTGKTTLARLLAERYETVWVPEYGREYSERTGKQLGDAWTTEEFRHIADVQAATEERLAQEANGILVCDTDLYTTARFHEVYLGARDAELERRARARRYDLYLLCGLDAPFVQDGWRADGPHRAAMDAAYRRHLVESGTPWVELRGSLDERLARACAAIDDLVVRSAA